MSVDVLVFEVDELQCAIESAVISECLRALAFRSIPGQPPFIAGVFDLRGTVVPVLDLHVRFGGTPRPVRLDDAFVVARAHRRSVALWVDRLVGLVPFDTRTFAARDGLMTGTRSFAGVARLGESLVMIHDVEAFLTQTEADALASLQIA